MKEYHQIINSLKYAILIRDEFRCQLCGRKGTLSLFDMFGVGFFCDLPVHHIYSRRNVLPENLITVCYECHVKLHDGAFRNGVRPKLIPTKPLTSAMVELGKELDYWANSNWDYKKKLLNIRFDKYYKK